MDHSTVQNERSRVAESVFTRKLLAVSQYPHECLLLCLSLYKTQMDWKYLPSFYHGIAPVTENEKVLAVSLPLASLEATVETSIVSY